MADEPMPASQANTMFWIGRVGAAAGPRAPPDAIDFLPFMRLHLGGGRRQVALVARRCPSSAGTTPTRKRHRRRAEHTDTVTPK